MNAAIGILLQNLSETFKVKASVRQQIHLTVGNAVLCQIFSDVFKTVAENAAGSCCHKHYYSAKSEAVMQGQKCHVHIIRIEVLILMHIPCVAQDIVM